MWLLKTDFVSIMDHFNMQVSEVVRWWCYYTKEILWQLLISLVAYLCVCIFLYMILKRVSHRSWQLPGPPARILLITAHPDDEVMFFGPMIYGITQNMDSEFYLLCLSNGGNNRRKEELWSCTQALGIPECNVTILMNTELPDNREMQWPEDIVAETILHHIEVYRINAVVTFDKSGVSQHKNHISLYYAIAALCMSKKVPHYCKLYVLESVNILRKYAQILDLPISLLCAPYWYLITYEQRHTIKDAMKAHKSQYVWFRKLYMIFSRYTLINTIQEVSALDLELELQFEDPP